MGVQIAVASDHAGLELKEEVRRHLTERGIEAVDFGPASEDSVDYPDYGQEVASRVSSGAFERGILICGAGIGMSIVANKFPGVRAALAMNIFSARMSRRHNNANVLVLAGRLTGKELAMAIVDEWLDNEFEGGRHQRRLDKISKIEKGLDESGHGE